MLRPFLFAPLALVLALALALAPAMASGADTAPVGGESAPVIARPGLFHSLTEPPCSYISTQHRKGLVRGDDPVIAWIRGAHNGGAIPLRHFLAAPRVINDTYGLFFYDPDGGYVSAFKKDYGYEFHGWRRGVMVVRDREGTLWSALSGRAIDGAEKGRRLTRVPSVPMTWEHWLMLHPESTAYDLFDGNTYAQANLPAILSADAKLSMGAVDARLAPEARVLGVEGARTFKAFPLDAAVERACYRDEIDGESIAVFWYRPTLSAVAFRARLDDRTLTFRADSVSPETAPFRDKETGTRWTLAGRGVDGPLKGRELEWVSSLQCKWYAWAAEYPDTEVHTPQSTAGEK